MGKKKRGLAALVLLVSDTYDNCRFHSMAGDIILGEEVERLAFVGIEIDLVL